MLRKSICKKFNQGFLIIYMYRSENIFMHRFKKKAFVITSV